MPSFSEGVFVVDPTMGSMTDADVFVAYFRLQDCGTSWCYCYHFEDGNDDESQNLSCHDSFNDVPISQSAKSYTLLERKR